jgi:hypothetical protein
MVPLLNYFRRYWLNTVGPMVLSVFGEPQRTNNGQEVQHRWFNLWVGQSKGELFNFLGKNMIRTLRGAGHSLHS